MSDKIFELSFYLKRKNFYCEFYLAKKILINR